MINLPAEVYTPQQLEAVIAELSAYAKQAGQSLVKQRVGLPAALPSVTFSPETQAVMTAAGGEELEQLTEELMQLRQAAPLVHVTLAAMPSEGLKKQLAAWLRQNISPQVLVSFNYRSALLGGMVVRTGSRTFDWSFRRQILASAPGFAQGFRHV